MKTLSTEKDLLLKVDKVFPWETFRGKLELLQEAQMGRHITPQNTLNQVHLPHLLE
ncbi:hypothetical protein SACC_26930 [Saccharolobus caldissimus]|uniref:Uncharacterized protein n=1 Tax=Saccharolobus caldissimus TaxID=1702097 RepID=A0AAQ4CV45_9CREN|nr:hypothetical protein SACC_26930 [Saccharolobus caldissimus]